MKSYAKICLKNHSQDKMIKEKRCPYVQVGTTVGGLHGDRSH